MRVFIRLLAALLGLVLAAAGVLLAIECAWALLRPGDSGLIINTAMLGHTLGGLSWRDTPVRIGAGVVALLGLILLLFTVRSGNREIRLHDPAPQVTVVTDARSLARVVGHQVRDQDGVDGAAVTASGTRVRVKATPRYAEHRELRGRLTETAQRAVTDLPLRTTPKVLVSVGNPKERP